MVRRRKLALSGLQELACELVASALAAVMLHAMWDVPWWPQAILLGLLLGFVGWVVLVDIDWFDDKSQPGKAGSSSSWWEDLFR
jgi:hypothetical protein